MRAPDAAIHLPVLGNYKPHIRPRLRRIRWMVLGLVYILMIAHIAHWLLAGKTLGPVVFSESMYTLETGRLNAGFVFFAVALTITLFCGRFLCGWFCHMAGLQELCAAILTKLGVRPRPFRSRILGFVPLGLALYMFVWPSFKRELLLPFLNTHLPSTAALLAPVPDFPGLKPDFLTTNLWSPLPGIVVCVIFLLVSGFATVLFLGTRGLCRYGCPYGGFFRYVEQLAPIRVTVNPALCDQCGRCTAACSTGVKVLDELLAYGSVVNKDCVRSLDCVSVCPTKALSFRLTRPAIFKRRPKVEAPHIHYDATLAEELLLLAVFIATLAVARGLYGMISLLLAASIALCTAFLVWRLLQLIRRKDVRQFGLQLKRAGRLLPAGYTFVVVGALFLALFAHSAAVRLILFRAGQVDSRVTASLDSVFSGDPSAIPDSDKQNAAHALRLYQLAGPTSRGGIALADTPASAVREAWLHLVLLQPADAERALRRVASNTIKDDAPLNRILGNRAPSDQLALELAAILQLQNKTDEAVTYLDAVVAANPTYTNSIDRLALIHYQSGRAEQSQAVYQRALDSLPPGDHAGAHTRASLAMLHLSLNAAAAAKSEITRAAADDPDDPSILHKLAQIRYATGDPAGAAAALRTAAAHDPRNAPALLQQADSISPK